MTCPKYQHENPEDSTFCGRCVTPLSGEAQPSLTKTREPPVMNLAEGTIIAGKYKIIEVLGRGRMGVVYKANDAHLKRTVALNFLPIELTHDAEVRERFILEAQ